MPDTTTATDAVALEVVSAPATTVTTKTADAPAETITTPVVPVSSTQPASITAEGEPNGLPPQAPGVQKDPPSEVIKLREWLHGLRDSVHSRDTAHWNAIHQHVEAICAMLHAKYPVES